MAAKLYKMALAAHLMMIAGVKGRTPQYQLILISPIKYAKYFQFLFEINRKRRMVRGRDFRLETKKSVVLQV